MRTSSDGSVPPIDSRSLIKPVSVTFQPEPTAPTRCASGTKTSLKNTSLNSASPLDCLMGRTSTPGARMLMKKLVRPSYFGTFGSVRASTRPKSAYCASVVQTFWPLSRQPD